MTNREYERLNRKKCPPSPTGKNCTFAFLIGGGICVLGQFLTQLYQTGGLAREDASGAASISLIFLSALLTGLNQYDNIAKVAGAGTLVPITGFSNSITAPALEFKSEGLILGLGAKMFTIAGPVLVYGIIASVLYGLVLVLFGLG